MSAWEAATFLSRHPIDEVNCCFSEGRAVLLTLTEACNQRCRHCMRSAGEAPLLPVAVDRIARSLTAARLCFQPERVVISGGEPTLLPNLDDVITAIVRLRLIPSLCTNATRLSAPLVRRLFEAGLRRVTIGIEGVGTDYDRFRGSRGGWSRMLSGLRHALAAGLRVTINVTLHDEVVGKAGEVAAALEPFELHAVTVTAPMIHGRMAANETALRTVTYARVRAFADTLTYRLACPVQMRVPRCNQSSCPSGVSIVSIDRTGILSDCPDIGAINAVDAARERCRGA